MRDTGVYMECPCCGGRAAQGMPGWDLIVSDGQPLACGCSGHISVDSDEDTEPSVIILDCDCKMHSPDCATKDPSCFYQAGCDCSKHEDHGRQTEPYGEPYDPDCPCRGSMLQKKCAELGCGFCVVAEQEKGKP